MPTLSNQALHNYGLDKPENIWKWSEQEFFLKIWQYKDIVVTLIIDQYWSCDQCHLFASLHHTPNSYEVAQIDQKV